MTTEGTVEPIGRILAREWLSKLNIDPSILDEPLEPEATAVCSLGDAGRDWCRGTGVRRVQGTFIEGHEGEVVPLLTTLRSIQYEYCPCPAGQAAHDRTEQAMAEHEAAAAQRAAERLSANAGLRGKLLGYTFDSYLELRGAKPDRVAALRRAERANAWVLMHGPEGIGKTWLGAASVRAALDAGRSAMYVGCEAFFERVRATYDEDADGRDTDVLDAAAGVDVLVIDELGGAAFSDWARSKFLRLIDERDVMERQTILITNLTEAELEDLVGRRALDRIQGNALDRATGESFVLDLDGESWRGQA